MSEKTCPPDGTPANTRHKLVNVDSSARNPPQTEFIWTGAAWTSRGATVSTSPEETWRLGWRYLGPAGMRFSGGER